ncbi:transcription termination/antitermination NusG family protein [Saccharospirillum sp.]|uniref:transcription termination/antitermination NusG family protein n=1 Tax=Saccharospirillum sp. TaxID=2033801 RepID=UPI0034A09081
MASNPAFNESTKPVWYLVQCKPREGFKATEQLVQQGFHCFHPTCTQLRKIGTERRWVTESLFPYYLFVRIKPYQSLSKVKYTRGVTRIVGFDGSPYQVSPSLVTAVMRQCQVLDTAEPEDFKAGDRVLITEGCFKDLKAIFKERRTNDRVVLLLNLINKEQAITIDDATIEPYRES